MPRYQVDHGLRDLGHEIIAAHRPHLADLKICYMFRDEAAVSEGRVVTGMCARADDRNWTVHGNDMIIEIARDVWNEAPSDDFRRAIMDHELGHVGVRLDSDGSLMVDGKTGRAKTFCRKHDIEEFEDVLERHGAYHFALRKFLVAYGRSKQKDETTED